MKVAILCGGLGTRLREETEFRPKPMVEVGGKPVLWHIMRHYSSFGKDDFVLMLGYKGEVIRRYFLDFAAMNSDVRIDVGSRRLDYLEPLDVESRWKITLAETGESTLTAGRLLRAARHLDGGTFMCTYGDGLSNVNIEKLLAFHRQKGKLVTVTGVRPFSRFGELEVRDGVAHGFREKPQLEGGWVNGGYFVMEPAVTRYLRDDVMLESEPLAELASEGQLAVYQHDGFWMPMDTYRDFVALNEAWHSGHPGWLDPA